MTAGLERLVDRYDGVLLDLDGTVYRGRVAVPEAVPAVHAVRALRRPVGYTTNNASRGPAEVAAQLVELGFEVDERQVVTSAQAGAALLAERLAAGDPVLVVGTEALAEEVRAASLTAVRLAADLPRGAQAGVVQGHSPATCWSDLAEACLAIRAGALWVACNVDPTLPTERGELPGNGSMVAALRAATGANPLVAGKPQRRLLDEAARRLSLGRPLVVGDRLDTDVAGASAAGMDALLVLTGVSRPADLLTAPPSLRPRYVAEDLRALLRPAAEAEVEAQVGAQVGAQAGAGTVVGTEVAGHPGWHVELRDGGTAALSYRGGAPPEPLAALRALCATAWPAGASVTAVTPADTATEHAVAALGLPTVPRG